MKYTREELLEKSPEELVEITSFNIDRLSNLNVHVWAIEHAIKIASINPEMSNIRTDAQYIVDQALILAKSEETLRELAAQQ